jgi:hypothetical protein
MSMSEERTSPLNNESDDSGLLLSVDPISDRSPNPLGLNDDTDATDESGDGEDIMADSDETDASDTDTDGTDEADGQD